MKKLDFKKYDDLSNLCDFVNGTWKIVYDSMEVVSITQDGTTHTLFFYTT